jgi:uncharacterized Zn-binding protein involved in type VI secretion
MANGTKRIKNGYCSGAHIRAAAPMEKIMKKLIAIAAMALTITVSGHVLAHGDKPKHGGVVQSASDLSFELVNKDGVATIYVEDHGKKLPTAGAAGKLTILNGTDKTEVPLESAGENTMITKGDAKLVKGAKAIASVTFSDKKTVNVRFAIK